MKKTVFLFLIMSSIVPTLFSFDRINYFLGDCLLGGDVIPERESPEITEPAPIIASIIHCASAQDLQELKVLVEELDGKPVIILLKKFDPALEVNKNEGFYSISLREETIALPSNVKNIFLKN